MRFIRLLKIIFVVLRFGLDEFLLAHVRTSWLLRPLNWLLFFRDVSRPRAERLRLALEALGPIFVKFGQLLSTRRDLIPTDIADELAKLQDRVPPFPSEQAVALLEQAYGKTLSEVFAEFDEVPEASASVAQVHFAVLPDGREVAVKILRPGILNVIEHDIALLQICAGLIERWWEDGKRLKPKLVVAEFDKYLHDELDMMRESANASQLRRNFADAKLLLVPEVYWDWCSAQVMVMERMHGIPISQIGAFARGGNRPVQTCRRTGSRSSIRRCSATVSSMPTCIPAISWWHTTGAMWRWTSASWARLRAPTRITSRRTLSLFSTAITSASPSCISSPVGLRRIRGWMNSRRLSAQYANRFSTSH